ncbi:MAG: hypothetical protein HOO96_04570 [Polyangiaceae bacterium]|nr:hypothetical protein [Polyangiaceae bacterium]
MVEVRESIDASAAWVVLGTLTVLFAATLFYALSRRRAALRSAMVDARPSGGVRTGTVAFARGESAAMQVTVFQVGMERREKKGTYTDWVEVARERMVLPFYLVQKDGTRLRVEPSDRSLLACAMATVRDTSVEEPGRFAKVERFRAVGPVAGRRGVAALADGERVWVRGTLGEGVDPEASGIYRGAASAPVLRCAAKAPLVVSTVPLEHDSLKLAAAHGRFAVVFATLLAIFSAFVAIPFVDVALGTPETARVTGVVPIHHKNGSVIGYRVDAEGRAGTVRDSLVSAPAVGSELPVRRGRLTTQVGETPSLYFLGPVLAAMALLIALALYRATVKRATPWYARAYLLSQESGTAAATATTGARMHDDG